MFITIIKYYILYLYFYITFVILFKYHPHKHMGNVYCFITMSTV